jgi:hypothetical protein
VARVHLTPGLMYTETWPGFESTIDPMLREQAKAYLEGMVSRIRDKTKVK